MDNYLGYRGLHRFFSCRFMVVYAAVVSSRFGVFNLLCPLFTDRIEKRQVQFARVSVGINRSDGENV